MKNKEDKEVKGDKDNSCIVGFLFGKLMDKKATNCCVFVVRIFVLDYWIWSFAYCLWFGNAQKVSIKFKNFQ